MKKISYYLAGVALAAAFLMPTSVFADDLEPELDEQPEPTFTMTFDFNGGATFDGQDTLTREGVSYAPMLNEDFLISCIDHDAENDDCHSLDVKKGKEFDKTCSEHVVSPVGIDKDDGKGLTAS